MLTAEGFLKRYVNKHLAKLGPLYKFMYVPSGFGRQTIDYLICYQGKFYGIETKAPGKEPTARQWQCMEEIKAAGGVAFACDSEEAFDQACVLYGLLPAEVGKLEPATAASVQQETDGDNSHDHDDHDLDDPASRLR